MIEASTKFSSSSQVYNLLKKGELIYFYKLDFWQNSLDLLFKLETLIAIDAQTPVFDLLANSISSSACCSLQASTRPSSSSQVYNLFKNGGLIYLYKLHFVAIRWNRPCQFNAICAPFMTCYEGWHF